MDQFDRGKIVFPRLPTKSLDSKFQTEFKNTPKLVADYFDNSYDLECGKNTFRIYRKGNTGEILFFIHGATCSSMSWAMMLKQLFMLKKDSNHYQCICYDLRWHGSSHSIEDREFSMDTLKMDTVNIIEKLFPNYSDPKFPGIFLVGHSLGGCIAVHVANHLPKAIRGLIVIDALEGMGRSSLTNFSTFINDRPVSFNNVQDGIKYMFQTERTSKNLKSAIIACIDQFKPITGTVYVNEANNNNDNESVPNSQPSSCSFYSSDHLANNPNQPVTWKVDLTQEKVQWLSWFHNLNELFLNCSPSKCLIVVGRERLDDRLVIAEMQGKFQIKYLPNCGHFIHEDDPIQVANIISTFVTRNSSYLPERFNMLANATKPR